MHRRDFVKTAAGALGATMAATLRAGGASPPRPPFRVLYDNDLTNATACVSPWHKKEQLFTPDLLQATVDEVAGKGVDVHLLQPGLGWVPMWPSRVLPLQEHFDWLRRTFSLQPDSYDRYLLSGGDLVRVFIDRCRLRGQSPFISFRLNDAHFKDYANAPAGRPMAQGTVQGLGTAHGLLRFDYEHPEYRIGADLKSWNQRVLNWMIPEVRAHKFAFLRELCENYDFDGLELDFLRHCSFFQLQRTTTAQRLAVMTAFVKDVRQVLDRTARSGRRRWRVRIPCYLAAHDPLGIDVAALADGGVDMFNLSPYYVMEQQTDVAAIRRRIPAAAVYAEFTHMTRPAAQIAAGIRRFCFRRAIVEQIQTLAHLAYARGLEGVSAFNFVYYRQHGMPFRGPFNEPPFDVFKHLGDPAWLARQPQHYFLTQTWDVHRIGHKPLGTPGVPEIVKPGQRRVWSWTWRRRPAAGAGTGGCAWNSPGPGRTKTSSWSTSIKRRCRRAQTSASLIRIPTHRC